MDSLKIYGYLEITSKNILLLLSAGDVLYDQYSDLNSICPSIFSPII